MFSKFTLAAAAGAVAITAMPAAASAQYRGGYDDHRYEQSYRGDRYRSDRHRYQRGDNYYGRNQAYYGDRSYNGQRCKGTTGTIVGGVAGAVLGRQIAGGSGGGFRRGGSGTTGTIIGAAIGALAGRAVDKSRCNNNRYDDRRYDDRRYDDRRYDDRYYR